MLGEDKVGFGSDFDGTIVPKRDQGRRRAAAPDRGAARAPATTLPLLRRLRFENWLRVLERTWAA